MLFTNWARVLYTGPLSNKPDGENAKIIEIVSKVQGDELYRIKYYDVNAHKNQELVVPENELAAPEEFVYRWISAFGESHRNYSTPGVALTQAKYNKGKRQRARVVWEDC